MATEESASIFSASQPVWLGQAMSGKPPMLKLTTGVPQANASSTVFGRLSSVEDELKMSRRAMQATASGRS